MFFASNATFTNLSSAIALFASLSIGHKRQRLINWFNAMIYFAMKQSAICNAPTLWRARLSIPKRIVLKPLCVGFRLGRPDLRGLIERLRNYSMLRRMKTFVDFRHAIRKRKLTGIDGTREMAQHASRTLHAINLPHDKHRCVQAIVIRGQRNQDDILVSDLSVLHD